MPLRKVFLSTGEIYHIYNRSVQGIPIFKGQRESRIFIDTVAFYMYANPPVKFSLYRINKERFATQRDQPLVTIINYCLMPNHFHFCLRQERDDGIRQFIQRISNSFAHYFSVKYKNRGPVFEGTFRAVRVETDEQLIHLSRYIHLNPVTAYLVKRPEDYAYSSYRIYMNKEQSPIIDPSLVIQAFRHPKDYETFVLNRKDYQRELDKIKHIALEDLPGS